MTVDPQVAPASDAAPDPEETAEPEGPALPRRPRRRRILRLSALPTSFTLGNLVCGFLAIAYLADAQTLYGAHSSTLASERIVMAGWMVLLGMVFDAVDGAVARLTRTTTEFGGELDSLADMVSFGVAPALIAKVLTQHAFGSVFDKLAFLTASFFAVCAALRLARYNAEHDDESAPTGYFKGLPTPGAAGVVAGVAIAHRDFLEWWGPEALGKSVGAHVLCFGVLMGLGLLMVSRVPFMHAANKLTQGRQSPGRVALALGVVMILFYLCPPQLVFVSVFALYAASGCVAFLPRLWKRRRSATSELFD